MAKNVQVVADWDSAALHLLKEMIGPDAEIAIAKALKKAGGDAIRGMKTESKKYIRARKRIKAGAIAKGLVVTFPQTAVIDDLEWRMKVKRGSAALRDFPARQVKSGVSVAVNQGSPRTTIKGAFFATMKSGHTGIFVRKSKQGRAIRELFTTRLVDLFDDTGMVPRVQRRGTDLFKGTFGRLLPIELARLK